MAASNIAITGKVINAVSGSGIDSVEIVTNEGAATISRADGQFELVFETNSIKKEHWGKEPPTMEWNPKKEAFFWSGLSENAAVHIYNACGQVVAAVPHVSPARRGEVSFENLPRGLFFVTLASTAVTQTYRVIRLPGLHGSFVAAHPVQSGSRSTAVVNKIAGSTVQTITFKRCGYATTSITLLVGPLATPKIEVKMSPSTSAACLSKMEGFASVPYGGVATTTGGGNAAPHRPVTIEELTQLLVDDTPRVIELTTSLEIGLLKVPSNKTLTGIGPNVTLSGSIAITGTEEAYKSNIIISNLSIKGYGHRPDGTLPVEGAGDAIELRFAHHVWIDHCNIYDGTSGNLNIVRGSDYVTVSWCKFWYTQMENKSRYSSLVSGGGSESHGQTDRGHLNTTWHHNWWAELCVERMPRYLWGKGHIYNNYYTSKDNNYCIRAESDAKMLIEYNYFKDVTEPFVYNTSATVRAVGNIEDNVKNGARETGLAGDAEPFPNPAPYHYILDRADIVPDVVTQCAGPQ